MMVRSPSQIIKSLSPLYLPSIVKAYDIYSKICIAMMIHFGNMYNRSIILNIRMHTGEIWNISFNSAATVYRSMITK